MKHRPTSLPSYPVTDITSSGQSFGDTRPEYSYRGFPLTMPVDVLLVALKVPAAPSVALRPLALELPAPSPLEVLLPGFEEEPLMEWFMPECDPSGCMDCIPPTRQLACDH